MKKKYCRQINNYIENLGIENTIEFINNFHFDDNFTFMFNSPEAEILAAYLNYSERNLFEINAKIMSFLNYYHYKSK